MITSLQLTRSLMIAVVVSSSFSLSDNSASHSLPRSKGVQAGKLMSWSSFRFIASVLLFFLRRQ